ncbi:integrase catalytic domain-containing protein [Nephila pilipes]|uniref:Integrase catalytic domain-containing protein n=1 Tax=Nephila pilipes TaxID=299642 RepID=A0A8X6IA67_NEPPI|nr:integrase catalytic domain-containing protein [Nephila pilipes]
MPLHKWATNSAELRELWEKNGFSIETSSNSIGQNVINYKVHGISWNNDRDIFYFDIETLLSFISKGTDTKRFLLQVAGRIFDPLGLIAPYVIRLKVLIQNVWEMGLLWDQEMPQIVKKPFKERCHELKDLHLVSIPRFYDFTDSNVVDVQLHSFSDSSKKVYGTVIYFRVVRTDLTISTSFVTSKSRVAPLKTHKDVKVDDVVLVEGSSKSKLLWDLGTIQETFQGRDGHVRACVVKTKKGLFRKPVQLIYPFELNE